MLALAGTIQGNTVIIENDDIINYDGKDVILTILEHPYRQDRKKLIGTNMEWKQIVENMQKSAAVISGCDIFLTNDKQLLQFKELKVLTMDNL